jgi:methylmalonyl-CoA/ethylmalonyl-CoA epimerase
MKNIDHVGIAVKDLEASNKLFSSLFNQEPFHIEEIESQKLIASFFKFNDTKVELLHPTSEESTIAKFISKKGEGVHHVAFEVDDIISEMERLKSEGYQPLTDKPYIGALNKLVCFLHPRDTNGVLIELCQKQ